MGTHSPLTGAKSFIHEKHGRTRVVHGRFYRGVFRFKLDQNGSMSLKHHKQQPTPRWPTMLNIIWIR